MRVIEPLYREFGNYRTFATKAVPHSIYPQWGSSTTYPPNTRVFHGDYDYQSVVQTQGEIPANNPTKWVRVGVVNRFKVFDKKLSDVSISPSTNTPDMEFEIGVGWEGGVSSVVDSIALFNVSAARAIITVVDGSGNVVETYSGFVLSRSENVSNWAEYFFDSFEQMRDYVFTGLYVTGGHTIRIRLQRNTGQDTTIGQIVVGKSCFLGDLLEDSRIGIQDYSRKERDEWGNPIIVPRPFSSTADFSIAVPNYRVRSVRDVMARLRATAAVYFDENADYNQATLVYGYYKTFDVNLQVGEMSFMDLEIEGLV